jgi:poly(A) polymerase
MKSCLRTWMRSKAVNKIFSALDGNARFVGGAVRDAILGIDASDIDIATPLLPEDVTKKLKGRGIKVVPTGIKHGTVTAIIGGNGYEITTLRIDVESLGRHATVAFTDSWQEDAARRDFTINAMSCTQTGEIFDYFGGMDDLAEKRLRFVGEAGLRCREDYLRILRYFRFFAYYGKDINMEAILACKEMAAGIDGLSGERIASEMLKLIAAPNPIYSLQLMVETGVIEYVIPGLTQSNIVFLERIVEMENIEAKDPIMRLAALLGKNMQIAEYIIDRWKLSKSSKKRLMFLCNPENKIPLADVRLAKKLLRVWGIENFIDMCLLGLVYGMGEVNFNTLYSLKNFTIPEFPLSGNDLLALGLNPGKEIGNALKFAKEWWEGNDYKPTKGEIIEFLRK